MKKNISFGRALRENGTDVNGNSENEKEGHRKTIRDVFEQLGIQNRAMIIHGASFPSGEKNTKIGSPHSKGAEKLTEFLDMNGFNSVQLGPGGKITPFDVSPYAGTVFSANPLFINPEELTTSKWHKILPADSDEYKAIFVTPDNSAVFSKTDYEHAFKTYEPALRLAFNNFKKEIESNNPEIIKLNKSFTEFKKENKQWLDKDALFEVISKANGIDDFRQWSDLDRNLNVYLNDDSNPQHKNAVERRNILISENKDEYEFYKFQQFICHKQEESNKEFRKKFDFKYIGDVLIGFSNRDIWANKDVVLENWYVGAPNGIKQDDGPQLWGIPVVDPQKLFNKDGSLAKGGELIKAKFEKLCKSYDNLRIDHSFGAVDPWIYTLKSDNAAFDYGNNISNLKHIDPDYKYGEILEKIVIPVLKNSGKDYKNTVWENLGSMTDKYRETEQKLNLPGISQLEWSRGEEAPKNNWSIVEAHDSNTTLGNARHKYAHSGYSWDHYYLAGYLNPDPADRSKSKGGTGKMDEFLSKLTNPVELAKAKFIELFRSSKNIQIDWRDFFGINVIYNTPGTFDNQKNWRAGLNNNFEEIYYKNLQNNDILALNMPEITAKALYAKDSMEVAKLSKDEVAKMVERELEKPEDNDVKKKVLDFSKNIIKVDDHNEKNKLTDEFKHTLFKLAQDAKRNELNEKHKDLFNRLAHYEKILKEPDQYNDTQNKNGVVYKKPEETPVCC